MKHTTQSLAGLPGQAAIALMAWAASTAHAAKVNDLPGGPAVNQLNLHPPVTKIAEAQSDLHWFLLIVCTVIFIGVFGLMFYSILHHRKSKGYKAAQFHESTTVEIVWTIVPFLIVVAMAAPATKVIIAQKDTTNPDLTIKATGYQWKWSYDYLAGEGEGIAFFSMLDPAQRALSNAGTPQGDDYLLKVDHPLVVPVGKKVRVITTANDVIHSWYVPSFGVKQDAIPGFVRDTWFRAEKTGDYYGQCAELCGKEHAYMPIHVKVLPQEEYSAWVKAQQQRPAGSPPVAAGAAAPAPAAGMPFQVFFASGQSGLDAEAGATLKTAAAWLKEHADVKVALSGFVDATGNADVNAELAKKRAQAVRDALQAAGVAAERIELRKPETITAGQGGSDREGRRVDIKAAS